MKGQRNLLFLICIIIIAGFLRFYQLGIIPMSLTWDEVALGYNAFAISIDGRDEFGVLLPYQYLLSFGDYKPPMYSYLSIIPVLLFGLNEFSVRFASAFFGTITVVVTYFLVKELFGKPGTKQNYVEFLALVSAFILALSPWHIMLSRAAFEANIATFFIVSGVWLFLLSMRKNPYLLVLATICFIASMYTFNSTRIVAPLLFLGLTIGFIKPLWKNKSSSIVALIVGIVLLLPLATYLVSPEAKLRYAEVNIFTNVELVETANQEIANDQNAWWSNIIHNRRVAYAREYITHYFDHFNPRFLFISGDENPKFSTHDVGQMYLWDFPFVILGILFLFKKREKYWWILPMWLLIGIIPAATARETPHGLRIESTLPTWQILSAYGFVTITLLLSRFKYLFIASAATVLLFFVALFLHGYFVHYPKQYAAQWQYGYKEVVLYLQANQQNYERVYISKGMERGYIYTLFYLQYDPQKFRQEAKVRKDAFGFVYVDQFDKYHFADEPQLIRSQGKKFMYVTSPYQVPKNANVIKEFKVLNGETVLVAFTKND